jgi:branched-chain amino acid transport system substrate-binding protein
MRIRTLVISFAILTFLLGTTAARAKEPVKLAVLTSLSGPLAVLGKSEADGAKMAVEEYGPLLGEKVELFIKDHAFNPGLAVTRAKELYEGEKVDAILACPNGAAALGVSDQALKNKRLFISTSAAVGDLIARNRYTIKWNYNEYQLANTAGLWGAEHLGKRWYAIAPDYVVGYALVKYYTEALKRKGGEFVGTDMVGLGTSDFSPYILKAIKAKPEVLAILGAGKDCVNAARAAVDYGLKKETKIVHGMLTEIDVKEAGLEIFEGNYVAASWYWKVENPGAREFADRFLKKYGERPSFLSAALYSAIWQYLEAVKRAGTKEQIPVIKALENHTFRDFFANPGYIRGEDHLQIAKTFLLKVKKPTEVKEKEDFFEIMGTVPPEEANPGPSYYGRKMIDF